MTAEQCPHGERVKRSGIGKSGPYAGLFCPERQCKPIWLPSDDDAHWQQYRAVEAAAKAVCRDTINAARAARDKIIADAYRQATVSDDVPPF